jgi:hypothetical protein
MAGTPSPQKSWGLDERGRLQPVVDYRLNSEEGRLVMALLGKF